MKLYPLSLFQIVLLLILVAIADIFTVVHGYVVPLGPLTYLLFVFVVLLVYFFIVKPKKWMALAGTLSFILGIVALVLVLIQDVIIAYHLSWRTPVFILGAVIGPCISGWMHGVVTRPR
jgi:hypothetical protein